MIKVAMIQNDSIVDVVIDADEASILSPGQDLGEDILVLEKNGREVAWFRYWSYAVRERKIDD